MNKIQLVLCGLIALTGIAAKGMSRGDIYYYDLRNAINRGYPWTFMETLNRMEAEGHALNGDDYDALKEYAQEKEFEKISILEDTLYQKLSAPVLRNDVNGFTARYVDMMSQGYVLSDDHLYWLLDLATRASAQDVRRVLADEFERRGLQTG